MQQTQPVLKPRNVKPEHVCGLAPVLLATNPASAEVLITYNMLVAQRTSYVTPHVWYAAACTMLKAKPVEQVARFCRALMYPDEAASGSVLDLSNSYLGVRGLLAVIVTLPLLGNAIRRLSLSRAGLDSTLMTLLCHSVTPAALPSLMELDVSHNPACSSVGGEALAEMLTRNPLIVVLDTDGLEIIGPVANRIQRLLAARVARS